MKQFQKWKDGIIIGVSLIILFILIMVMIEVNAQLLSNIIDKRIEQKLDTNDDYYYIYEAENGTQYRLDDLCDFEEPDLKCEIVISQARILGGISRVVLE